MYPQVRLVIVNKWFAPLGTLGNAGSSYFYLFFLVVTTGGWGYLLLASNGRGQDDRKHPTLHRQAPQLIIIQPNCQQCRDG
jgi:hypothetical protein